MNAYFFIRKVSCFLPRNKAMSEVIEAVKKLEFKTIASPEDLQKFEQHLKDVVDSTNKNNSACKPLSVKKTIGMDGVRTFSFGVSKKMDSSFCFIEVCYVRGAWRE